MYRSLRIVGFIGRKQSGKDTAADYLVENNIAHAKHAFMDPFKSILMTVFNMKRDLLYVDHLKERPFKVPIRLRDSEFREIVQLMNDFVPYCGYTENDWRDLVGTVIESPRRLMQFLGTDFVRKRISPSWHLHAAFSERGLDLIKTRHINAPPVVLCMSDIRFKNEVTFLRDMFGQNALIYFISRMPNGMQNTRQNATDQHESETGVDELAKCVDDDKILCNYGTLGDYRDLLQYTFAT
jgi:hypothetical protein